MAHKKREKKQGGTVIATKTEQKIKLKMINKRQLTTILPRIVTVLIIKLEDEQVRSIVLNNKNFLNLFPLAAKEAERREPIDKFLVEILGTISDLAISTKFNPYKSLPMNTPEEIMLWFLKYIEYHFSVKELEWNGKIGNKVLDFMKIFQNL